MRSPMSGSPQIRAHISASMTGIPQRLMTHPLQGGEPLPTEHGLHGQPRGGGETDRERSGGAAALHHVERLDGHADHGGECVMPAVGAGCVGEGGANVAHLVGGEDEAGAR